MEFYQILDKLLSIQSSVMVLCSCLFKTWSLVLEKTFILVNTCFDRLCPFPSLCSPIAFMFGNFSILSERNGTLLILQKNTAMVLSSEMSKEALQIVHSSCWSTTTQCKLQSFAFNAACFSNGHRFEIDLYLFLTNRKGHVIDKLDGTFWPAP